MYSSCEGIPGKVVNASTNMFNFPDLQHLENKYA